MKDLRDLEDMMIHDVHRIGHEQFPRGATRGANSSRRKSLSLFVTSRGNSSDRDNRIERIGADSSRRDDLGRVPWGEMTLAKYGPTGFSSTTRDCWNPYFKTRGVLQVRPLKGFTRVCRRRKEASRIYKIVTEVASQLKMGAGASKLKDVIQFDYRSAIRAVK